MAKFGKKFTYNGKSSEDFHLRICGLEEELDAPLALDREVEKGDVNRYRKRANHFGTRYQDVLSFNVHVIKDPEYYPAPKDQPFTRSELRAITSWLTAPQYPGLFHMYDYESATQEEVDYFGLFSNVETFFYGQLYGLKLTFVCDSPYGYSAEKVFTGLCTDSTVLEVSNQSDELEDYLYPVIEIIPSATGSITITNQTDGGRSVTLLLKQFLPVTMDCQRLMVRDAAGLIDLADLGFGDEDTVYWPRLLAGSNTIEILGDCTITFRFREPRKAGAY